MTNAILTREQYAAISKESDLTQEVLKECVHYDPLTGDFTWLERPKEHFKTLTSWATVKSMNAGKRAGKAIHQRSFLNLFNMPVKAERAAWLYVHGALPEREAIHIDHDSMNNAIANIRELDVLAIERYASINSELDLTLNVIKECVSYNPETGELVWQARPREHFKTNKSWSHMSSRDTGRPAASSRHGAKSVNIFNIKLEAGRLALWISKGEPPCRDIDYLDGDRMNTRLSNLEISPAKIDEADIELTAELARKCLSYNPKTGVFVWKKRPRSHFQTSTGWRLFQSRSQGEIAGTITGGYVDIKLFERKYRAHRLAWLMTHGEWPEHVTDHEDGDRSFNAIGNLRSVTQAENMHNLEISKRNTSGVVGVFKSHCKSKPWRASIYCKGKKYDLGYFETKEEAAIARKKAEVEHGFHSNHGRSKVVHAERIHR